MGQRRPSLLSSTTVLVGPPLKQKREDALHLWHPRVGISGNDRWVGEAPDQHKANIMLKGRYRSARTKEAMRALLENGWCRYDG
jgi:hypothetical protein